MLNTPALIWHGMNRRQIEGLPGIWIMTVQTRERCHKPLHHRHQQHSFLNLNSIMVLDLLCGRRFTYFFVLICKKIKHYKRIIIGRIFACFNIAAVGWVSQNYEWFKVFWSTTEPQSVQEGKVPLCLSDTQWLLKQHNTVHQSSSHVTREENSRQGNLL